jgi:hypothetical protein
MLNYVIVGIIAAFAAIMLVNALVAATIHRRDELGLLRLAGSTPAQARRMVALESVVLLVTRSSPRRRCGGVHRRAVRDRPDRLAVPRERAGCRQQRRRGRRSPYARRRARGSPACAPEPGDRGRQTLGGVTTPRRSLRRVFVTSICRDFEDGSDGTRTRDLQRDRPAF